MFGINTNSSTENFSEKISNTKNFIQISLVKTSEILTSFHQNKAMSLFNKIISFLSEFLFYALALSMIAIIFFFNKLEPFTVFSEILVQKDITDIIGENKINRLDFTVKALIAFISFLFIVIGFFIRSKRNAVSNLNIATTKVKAIDSNLKESQQELEELFVAPEKAQENTTEVLTKVEPKDILL